MAGVDQGVSVSWEAIGAIGALIVGLGAVGGQIGTWYKTKFLTDEHEKKLTSHDEQFADIMGKLQQLSDNKAGRDEMRAAVADLKDTFKNSIADMERKVDASDSRVERTVTTLVSTVTSQITTLTARIDAMMQRSRAHSP